MRIIYRGLKLQIVGSKLELAGRLATIRRIGELRSSVAIRAGGTP